MWCSLSSLRMPEFHQKLERRISIPCSLFTRRRAIPYQQSTPPPTSCLACSSLFVRLAEQTTALRAWCYERLPGRWKTGILHPGIAGMWRSMAIRAMAKHDIKSPLAPPFARRTPGAGQVQALTCAAAISNDEGGSSFILGGSSGNLLKWEPCFKRDLPRYRVVCLSQTVALLKWEP